MLLGQEKAQTWTNVKGKNVEAQFVKLNGVSLVLLKTDGQEITIPLSMLDDKSRLRARKLAKAPPFRPKLDETDSLNGESGLEGSSPTVWASETPVSFSDNQTAEDFVAVLDNELKKRNLLVFWDMLPAKKQSEVQDLVRLASTRIEQRTLDLIKRFRSELIGALRSKKEFVLNSKAIPFPPGQKELLEDTYDSSVSFVEALVAEDLLNTSTLQNSELRDIAKKYINELMARSVELDQLIPADSPMKSESLNPKLDFQFQVDSSTQYEAMISGVGPGQTNRVPEKFSFVEGRWMPTEMVQAWDATMAQATNGLQSIEPKATHQMIGQGLLFANGVLASVSSAETQEDFDEAIQQLVGLVQMGMSRGGGAPAPGGMPQSGSSSGQPGFSGGAGMPSAPAGSGSAFGPMRPGSASSGSPGGNSGGNSGSGGSFSGG